MRRDPPLQSLKLVSKPALAALGILLCVLPAVAQATGSDAGLTQAGVAQSGLDPLGPTSQRLKALERCLPSGDPALADLKTGLITGWNNWHKTERGPAPSAPSLEYSASLDRDIEACGYASTLADPAQRAAIVRAVEEDVDIKAKDCRKFGMSRKIEVRLSTLLGSTPENGWAVFYKWTGASMFPAEELRFPNLTSPAIVELPPGKYMFHAERNASDNSVRSTQPVIIVVGSERTIECQLAIQ